MSGVAVDRLDAPGGRKVEKAGLGTYDDLSIRHPPGWRGRLKASPPCAAIEYRSCQGSGVGATAARGLRSIRRLSFTICGHRTNSVAA